MESNSRLDSLFFLYTLKSQGRKLSTLPAAWECQLPVPLCSCFCWSLFLCTILSKLFLFSFSLQDVKTSLYLCVWESQCIKSENKQTKTLYPSSKEQRVHSLEASLDKEILYSDPFLEGVMPWYVYTIWCKKNFTLTKFFFENFIL